MSDQLLPSDKYLASILGLTEEEYRHFQTEVRKRAAEGPQPAVVNGSETALVLGIISLVLSVGATVVSLLLRPSLPDLSKRGAPKQREDAVDPIIRNDRFAPRYGFDSQQDIATIGSIIPIVYAKRELIVGEDSQSPNVEYGGVRINMPMLWNQILSLGNSQMLRAVFLLGEGNVSSVNPANFAIGNNTLQGYLFESDSATQAGSRCTVYFNGDGGRIAGTDRVAGRSNANDDGSSSSSDVFQVYWNNANQTDFCSSFKPNTQTTFGVYAPIGNDLMYKVNPQLRPGVRSKLKNFDDGDVRVRCLADTQQLNVRDKYRAPFSTLSGLINESISADSEDRSVNVGDTLTYKIFNESHKDVIFDNHVDPESDNDDATAKDVASSVASMQKSWDDSLAIGEIYKVGSALAVCVSRTSERFVSDADIQGSATGEPITATFEVIRGGQIREHKSNYLKNVTSVETGALADQPNRAVATNGAHLFKYASAHIPTSRACQAVEIGLRSTLGARINGLCNFQEAKKYSTMDNDFCRAYSRTDPEDILNIFHQSGSISTPFERYSFFRIKWRDYGNLNWNYLNNTYGTRSESQQPVFNYIRLEFTSNKQREFMFEPVTGYEVRNNLDGGTSLYVFDYKNTVNTFSENGCTVSFRGESVSRSIDSFGINEAYGVAGQDELYRYKEQAEGGGVSANLSVAATLPANTATVEDLEFNITANDEGTVNLPLINNNTSFYGKLGTRLGTLTRTSGAPISNGYFSFTADVTEATPQTFAVGTSFVHYKADGTTVEDIDFKILKGLPKTDTNTYIDDYAKLAETFVYSEISSSAESAPEHEVVYFNEIVPNDGAPAYDDLALVGLNIRSSADIQQFSQFSAYVTGGKECLKMLGGTGPTHLFPDILYDLMTNSRYGAGTYIKPYMIDTDSFAAAATWCESRKYFYDAGISEPINIRQWAADNAATHLLHFGESNGKFFLRPAIPFSPVTISGLFTAGNIVEDSFKLTYFDPEDRDPIQVSVRYREERPTSDITGPGLFPVMREVLVREADASSTDPIELLDMSNYCTSRDHAIDAAKYVIRTRRLSQHVITFNTTHDGVVAAIAPTDYIKVAMDETEYDEFNNGVVTPEGALVSTKQLSDGQHDVVLWDGIDSNPPVDSVLTVSSGGTQATPTGIVFTVKSQSTQVRVYQIESITSNEDGTFTIQAMYTPVNSRGYLQLADGFDATTNWSIDNS